MRRSCPTINELLAFEASARYLSFTRAASELCITQSAVSRNVISLEDFLGVKLFHRIGKVLELTPEGAAFLEKISVGLRIIEAASLEVLAMKSGGGVVNIACLPTLAANWLIPRLRFFRAEHPNIVVNFLPHVPRGASIPTEADAVIRYGTGDWTDCESRYLVGREVVVIASPDLVPPGQPFDLRQALSAHTVLHHATNPLAWEQWAQPRGIAPEALRAGPRYEQYNLIIQAVISGLGIGLVPRCMVEHELNLQQVVCLNSDKPDFLREGYHICFSKEKANRAALATLVSWLGQYPSSERVEQATGA